MKSWDLFIYIIMAGIVLTIEGGHLHSSFRIHCTLILHTWIESTEKRNIICLRIP